MTDDYDARSATFNGITEVAEAEWAAREASRNTADTVTPLPPETAELNREQIAATRGVVLGCSFIALTAISFLVLVGVATLLGWL